MKWSMCHLGFLEQGLRPKQKSGDSSPKGWDLNHTRRWKIWWLVDIFPGICLPFGHTPLNSVKTKEELLLFQIVFTPWNTKELTKRTNLAYVMQPPCFTWVRSPVSQYPFPYPYTAIFSERWYGRSNQSVDQDVHVEPLLHRQCLHWNFSCWRWPCSQRYSPKRSLN